MITRPHTLQRQSVRRPSRRGIKFESARRFLARLASRRAQRRAALLTALLLGGLTLSTLRVSANTEDDVINGQTDLTLGTTYAGGLPTATSDVTFTNTAYAPAAFTLGSALTVGTLNDLSTTALTISGAGTLTLSGGTNVVAPNAADLLYVATGGSLTISSGIALTTAAASGNFDIAGLSTLSGVISGTGFGFTKTGTGTLTLSGTNSYSGGTNINAGTVSISNAAGFGTGTVAVGGSGTATLAGINGNVANVFTGTGNFTVNGAGNTTVLTSATALNGFTGTVNINTTGNGKLSLNTVGQTIGSGATVNVGSNATFYSAVANTYSGVTFNLNGLGNGELLGALRLEGATIAANSTVNLLANSSLGGNTTAGTIAAPITGTGFGFNKVGNNQINLGGTNTYTGATNVNGGTLAFTGTGSSASSAASVVGNQQLLFNAAGNGTGTTTRLASVTLSNQNNTNPNNGSGQIGLVLNNGSNTTATTDAISGNITIGGSFNNNGAIGFAGSGSAGASETLQANGLVQANAGSILNVNTSTVTLGTNAFLKLTNAPTQIGAGGTAAAFTQSILPWATNNNAGFLTYDATNGLIRVATTALVSGNTTLVNASNSGGALNLTADTTVNSLYDTSTGTLSGNAGTTLTVNSGGLLFTAAKTVSVPTIAFGASTGYIGVEGRLVTISSVLTGSGGVTFFTNQGGGGGFTVLQGANTFTGVTNLSAAGNSGAQLILDNTNALQNSTLNLTSGSIAIGIATDNITTLNLGGLSGSVNINLTNAATTPASVALTVGSDNDSTTYSGVLGNGSVAGGSLTKVGTGTLTLTNTNTYSGGTTITGGAISVATDNFVGTGGITLNGGTLNFTNTTALTATRIVTVGASGGTISETGAATTGANSRVIFNTANQLLGSGNLTVSGNGTLGGTTGTTNTGAGAFVVSKTNTFSGNITPQSGGIFEYSVANAIANTATITLGNEGETAINSGLTVANALTVSGGTNSVLSFENGNAGVFSGPITANATLTVGLRDWYNYATARSGSITGLISGAGGLTTTGGGTLTLTQAEAYTGATTIGTGSTLKTSGSNNVLASSSGVTIASGATLDTNGNVAAVVNNLSGAGAITSTFSPNNSGLALTNNAASTFSGVIGNQIQSTVTKSGTGTLTFSGTNTYTGPTVISGGTLALTKAGTVLNVSPFTTTGGTLTGTPSIRVNGGGTLLLGASNTISSGAATSGTGNGGTGVTLAGGILSVTAGVTQGQGAVVTGGVNNDPRSPADIPGLGALTLTSSSTLNFTGTSGTLVFNTFTPGGFTLSVGGTNFATLNGNSSDGVTDRLIFENDGGVPSGTFLAAFQFTNYGNSGATDINLGDGFYEIIPSMTAVPEPSTWVAGMLLVGALGFHQRRRVAGMFKRQSAA